MKGIFYLIIFLFIISCSTDRVIYWCGDHPCINKKEREAYFKKTMTVEIKKMNKSASENNSDIEKIIQQTQVKEKRRIKEEKNMAKQIERDEAKIIKKEKKTSKQADLENTTIASTNFNKLVEKITKKNILRPYPDINDIPN